MRGLSKCCAMRRTCADRTGGAFDVTVQPLWDAFTQAKARGGLPSADAVRDAARALVGWRDLDVSDDAVRLRRPAWR